MLKELLYGSGKMPARSGRLWSFLVLSVLIYSTFWVLFIMQVEYVFCRLLHGDQCKSKKNPIWEIAHFLVFFNLDVPMDVSSGRFPKYFNFGKLLNEIRHNAETKIMEEMLQIVEHSDS